LHEFEVFRTMIDLVITPEHVRCAVSGDFPETRLVQFCWTTGERHGVNSMVRT
jgi:hypothetical protein